MTVSAINKLVIDCDSPVVAPRGLVNHQFARLGVIEWNKENFSNPDLLYLCDEQKIGSVVGFSLGKKLEAKIVMNDCVLDALICNQDQIPEVWKGKVIFFWGSVYRDTRNKKLCVRCLYWNGKCWVSRYFYFEEVFHACDYALLAA